MKLATAVAKTFTGKAKVLSTLGALVVGAAALTAATPAANAQVAFGVTVGGPRYYAPVPAPRPVYRPYVYEPGFAAYGYAPGGYWAQRRQEDWRARAAWDRRHNERYDRAPFYVR